MASDFRERARRLRNAVEPVAAGVYFAPEAHAGYAELGFDGSPVSQDGVAHPDLKAYFTSRGARLGQVAGEVVAAAFGCFNPKVVVPAVEAGWQVTNWQAILQARERAATRMLARVLGDEPEGLGRVTELLHRAAAVAPWAGRCIYGGLRSLGLPGYPLGDMWPAADLLREHRGDSHVISWAVGGADAVEVRLLTEQWWGLPARAYTPSRGWSGPDMDAGFDRLQRRGPMTRDEQLVEHLDAWSDAIITAGSYPKRVAGVYNIGGGPHFGSGLTIDTAAELHGTKTLTASRSKVGRPLVRRVLSRGRGTRPWAARSKTGRVMAGAYTQSLNESSRAVRSRLGAVRCARVPGPSGPLGRRGPPAEHKAVHDDVGHGDCGRRGGGPGEDPSERHVGVARGRFVPAGEPAVSERERALHRPGGDHLHHCDLDSLARCLDVFRCQVSGRVLGGVLMRGHAPRVSRESAWSSSSPERRFHLRGDAVGPSPPGRPRCNDELTRRPTEDRGCDVHS